MSSFILILYLELNLHQRRDTNFQEHLTHGKMGEICCRHDSLKTWISLLWKDDKLWFYFYWLKTKKSWLNRPPQVGTVVYSSEPFIILMLLQRTLDCQSLFCQILGSTWLNLNLIIVSSSFKVLWLRGSLLFKDSILATTINLWHLWNSPGPFSRA